VLEGVVAGHISLAFRRWHRPTVKTGGRLRTAVGVLAIEAVDAISMDAIRSAEAIDAGYTSLEALLQELRAREGTLYRIRLRFAGRDPREALRRESVLTAAELDDVRQRLQRLDSRSPRGPWTEDVLRLIDTHPGTLAANLARMLGSEKLSFKADVRKLKELGLTESLEVGYRLSPRGRVVLARLSKG
jgi:hypothetical protein